MRYLLPLLAATILVFASGEASAVCNVRTFGAVGDGVANDRAAFQSAIDTCATTDRDVYVPPGTYLLGKAPFSYWSITLPSGTRLRGDGAAGTMLRLPANTVGSHRLIYAYGEDTRIESLTLYGDRASQTRAPEPGAEHRHGVFAVGTTRLTIVGVVVREFTGDGVYLYTGSRETTVRDSSLIDNDRSGISLATNIDGVIITANRIARNGVQQIDTEPVHPSVVRHVSIIGNLIDGSTTNAQALTISGPRWDNPSSDFVVGNNVIRGGIHVVYAERVSITGNAIINHSTKPGVTAYRASRRLVVAGNTIHQTQTSTAAVPALDVLGTGTPDMPEDISLESNVVHVAHPDCWGVRISSVRSVAVRNNTMTGPGLASATTYGAGIYLRAVHLTDLLRYVDISHNVIRDFGRYGIIVAGNGTPDAGARIEVAKISDNLFESTVTPPSMVTAMRLDDGLHPIQGMTVRDNVCLRMQTCLAGVPAGATAVVAPTASNTGWLVK